MHCPACRKNSGNFLRDCPECGARLLPGKLGEAHPGNGKRRISLRAATSETKKPEIEQPAFHESAHPLAVRENRGLTPSEGLPGSELLELLEFTTQELQDATEDYQRQIEESAEDDPSAKIHLLQKLRAARKDLEKRVIVRVDIARLQFEELAQKESRPIVEGVSKRCVLMDNQIRQLLEGLTALLEG